MKLITKAVASKLPELYSTEHEKDPLCIVKIFHPFSSYTVYLTEYDKNTGLAFGYVTGTGSDELGYIHISELQSIKFMGLGMERDMHYKPERLSEVKKRIAATQESGN